MIEQEPARPDDGRAYESNEPLQREANADLGATDIDLSAASLSSFRFEDRSPNSAPSSDDEQAKRLLERLLAGDGPPMEARDGAQEPAERTGQEEKASPPNAGEQLNTRGPEGNPRQPAKKPTPQQNKPNPLLKWLLIGSIATSGWLMLNGGRNSAERKEQEMRETLSPEQLSSPITGLSEVLSGVDQAIDLIRRGVFEDKVVELENHISGGFTYAFTVKEEHSNQKNKTVFLTGIEPSSADRNSLLRALSANSMIVTNEPQVVDDGNKSNWFVSMLPMIAFYGLLLGGLFWLTRRGMKGQGGMMNNFMNAEGEVVRGGQLPDRFSDLGGLGEVIDELTELRHKIDMLRNGRSVELPRGTLFSGPPGVGKTKLARSLAGELEIPFVKFDCSQLSTQLLVGSGTARVSNAFASARKIRDEETARLREQPGATGTEEAVVILFLDEFESIGSKRRNEQFMGGGDSEHVKVVNTLLNEMDGFNQKRNKNIIIFAATNSPDALDPALLRPGRFTKNIQVDLPRSPQQRLEILNALRGPFIEAKGMHIADEKALEYVSKITPGKSGDHLRQILVEASDIARIANRTSISQQDLFEASQRADSGRIKRNYLPREKHELVAHHEHGHALASLACGVNIFLVSMLPRGSSAGRVIPDPEGLSESLTTQRDYLARVLLGAGGRAAERVRYGQTGTTDGAVSDIQQIQAVISHMISVGMIGEQYSLNLHKTPPHEWPEEHHKLINEVAENAVKTAEKIIQSIGEEMMEELVKESLDIGRELVGDEAQEFYENRIPAQKLEQMRKIADGFLKNPRKA